MILHGLLHGQPHGRRGGGSVGEPQLVNVGHGGLSSIAAQLTDRLSGLVFLGDGMGNGSAKDNQVQEGVGAEPVGSVNGGARGLTGGIEAGDNLEF